MPSTTIRAAVPMGIFSMAVLIRNIVLPPHRAPKRHDFSGLIIQQEYVNLALKKKTRKGLAKRKKICYNTGRKVNKAGRFARHGTDAGSGMGCKSPRVGHCDARTPRSVRYVRTRPVLLPSPGVYGRIFFVRTAGGCADFFVWRFSSPESAVRKAAQPMCFPGSLRRSPSAVCCQQKEPPSALGTAEGGFFAMK